MATHCAKCDKISTDNVCQSVKDRIPVSGTKIRNALKNSEPISKRFMRPEIVQSIINKEIFINEED